MGPAMPPHPDRVSRILTGDANGWNWLAPAAAEAAGATLGVPTLGVGTGVRTGEGPGEIGTEEDTGRGAAPPEGDGLGCAAEARTG